jgi:hypothetical protein
MDPLPVARAVASSRVLFGAAIIAAPRLTAGFWVGPRRARGPETAVLGRALGARDVALGVLSLQALRRGDPSATRAAMVVCAACDGTDLLATLAERRRLPSITAGVGAASALGATAVAIAAALAADRAARSDGVVQTRQVTE